MRPVFLAPPLALLALAACQEDDDARVVNDTCGASAWVELIGDHRDVLEGADLPERVRVIGPTDMVTTDYLEERVNFYLDEDRVITRIECG